jgi:excisionase family DNA binding protein
MGTKPHQTEVVADEPPAARSAAVFLTTEQAAGRLQLSKRYLEMLRLKGNGPAYAAFGRAIRYRATDVDAWAASKTRRSTSDAGGAA